MSEQVRAVLGRAQTEMPSRLPLRRRRHTLTVLSVILGIALGVAYSWLMLNEHRWLVYVLTAVGGSCLVFLLVVIPQLLWAVLRKAWFGIMLRQNSDQAQALAARAQRDLTAGDGDTAVSGETANDLAVIACLRRDYAGAAQMLAPVVAAGQTEAANLLVALAETEQWDRLKELVAGPTVQHDGVPEASLARAACVSPAGPITSHLEDMARTRRFPRVLNNLGVRALRAWETEHSAGDFSLALQQRPHYALARANLGVLAFRQGEAQEALTETASAAALGAGEAIICNNLGALLCQAGDLWLAERWLLRAHHLEARSPAVEVNLGNAYAVQGKYQEALEAYATAGHLGESARGDSAARLHDTALVHFARQEYEPALEAAELAREKAPADHDLLNNLGCYQWQAGRYEEAEQCFQEAAALAPGGVAEANLLTAALAAGRTAEVLERLGQDEERREDQVFDRGLAYLLTALGIDAKASATQAKLYAYNLSAADAEFRKVVPTGESGVTAAWVNLGLINYLSRDYEDAAEAFVNSTKRAGENSELLYPTAVCYLMGGVQTQEQHGAGPEDALVPAARDVFRKAKPYLEKALEVRSVAGPAAYNLGVLHYLLGDYDKAIALLKRAAVTDAPPHVFNSLAIAEARRAQELQREFAASHAGVQRKRQIAQQVSKLLSSAIHYFREVLRVQPHSPIVHANIGLAFMLRNQQDDVETAMHHWNLMRQVGGEWGQRAFDLFSRAMSSEEARKLRFQAIEMTFQPLPVADWITFVPPRLTGLKYVLEDLCDLPDWQFVAYHPLVQRALRYRAKAQVLQERLAHLAV
jgi:tetratricopeptide (TPR) repeat protein